MISETAIRRAAVAGMFYPGSGAELDREVHQLLDQSPSSNSLDETGTLAALIVPHAGYMYSGATAARAYSLLRTRRFDTCVLVGPSHHEYFGGISIYPGAAYETPLGLCRIDDGIRRALLSCSMSITSTIEGHRKEHSLEVQLPFVQTLLPDAAIVPVVMGDQRAEFCRVLGEALARAVRGKNVLLIASSDLSHFYSAQTARKKDAQVLRLIEAFDVPELLLQLEADTCEACGGGPIAAVMTAAGLLGAHRATIVDACNSGDVTGETDRVVGYCSAALWIPS